MNVDVRVGSGFDVHPFAAGGTLRIAGVDVPEAPGLEGHSDADVVAHAVADALLGAMAAGDLGSRFGEDDPAMRGADSMGLLGDVVAEALDGGWQIGNADVVVVAQRPRLAPYREAMRASLAGVLGCELGRVSVKFTTTDGLGSIGRAEGVAAWATCLLTGVRR